MIVIIIHKSLLYVLGPSELKDFGSRQKISNHLGNVNFVVQFIILNDYKWIVNDIRYSKLIYDNVKSLDQKLWL